jgi:4'-phosphopantetheinyl transferase
VRFSVTHTFGFAACAITNSLRVGVDVEHISRARQIAAVADFAFGGEERDALGRLRGPKRDHELVRLWTLKEAYSKARGLGLRLPFDQCQFHSATPSPTVVFGESISDRPEQWWFWTSELVTGHRLALAIGSGEANRPPRQKVSIIDIETLN